MYDAAVSRATLTSRPFARDLYSNFSFITDTGSVLYSRRFESWNKSENSKMSIKMEKRTAIKFNGAK